MYYVSPQVWAWHRSRVTGIARWVSQMLVLFPFELDFYERHAVSVTDLGHPLVDEVPELPRAWDRMPATEEGDPPHRRLVLEGPVASELMQEDAIPEKIVPRLATLLSGGGEVRKMRRRRRDLRPKLGRGGASGRAADVVVDLLQRLGEGRGKSA